MGLYLDACNNGSKKCLDGARNLAAHPLTFLALNPFFSLWPIRNTPPKKHAADFLIFAMRHGFATSYIPFVMIFLMAANDGRTS
jgi:hypothetical protein